jgi:hypothetical protein
MPSRRLEQPIVAVAVAEDPACVDMVDGRLIENLHVDDARHVLAWADAIAERATHRLTLRRQAHVQDGQRRVIPCRLRRRKRLSGVCWRSGSPRSSACDRLYRQAPSRCHFVAIPGGDSG